MARDCAWAALAVVAGVLTALNLAACLFFLLRGEWAVLLRVPFAVLFGYWIAMGAWRRTTWGRPPLTDHGGVGVPAHTGTMILLALGAAVALALALGVQAALGRT